MQVRKQNCHHNKIVHSDQNTGHEIVHLVHLFLKYEGNVYKKKT